MKNTNTSGLLSIKPQKDVKIEKKYLVPLALLFLMGVLFPRITVYGNLSPFGISLTAAAGGGLTLPITIASLIGYFINGQLSAMRYIAAIVAVVGIRWSVSGFTKVTQSVWFAPIAAFLACFISGGTMTTSQEVSLVKFLLLLFESILTAGAAYFCDLYIKTWLSFDKSISKQDVCIGNSAFFTLVLLSLFTVQWEGISLGRTVAMLCILIASRVGNVKGGTVVGSIIGFGVLLAFPENSLYIPVFAFGGLLAGLFSHRAKLISCAALLLSYALIFPIIEGALNITFIIGIYEIVIASFLFVVLPHKIEDFITAPFIEKESTVTLASAALKLKQAAESIRNVATVMDRVSHKFSDKEYPASSVIQNVSDEVCTRCKRRFVCWEKRYTDTTDTLNHAIQLLKQGYPLSENRLTGYLAETCERKKLLCDTLSQRYSDFLMHETVLQQIEEFRQLVNGQLQNTAQMLTDFSEKFKNTCDSTARPRFFTQVGFSQVCCKGEKLCGDSYELAQDDDGNEYFILSDGMGSGANAAVDGAVAAGITAELLKSGFGYDSVLQLVNTALITKSSEETLATLDIARINMKTGKFELLKAGAGDSLLLSHQRVTVFNQVSLPLGILQEVSIAKCQDELSHGDVLLLMSDGVSNGDMDAVKEQLQQFDPFTQTIQELSDNILKEAIRRCTDEKGDDMTVVAILLKKCE